MGHLQDVEASVVPMNLTVVAASGRIGGRIVEQALAAGHQVTAVVRDPTKVAADVRVVVVDLLDPDGSALEFAVEEGDAVLSGLGPRRRSETGVASRGTGFLIDAMQAVHTRRLVVVSASPLGTVPSPARPKPPKHDPGDGFFMRHLLAPMARTMYREHYADLALMEDDVRDSGLDWTIVRPPRLTNGPLTRSYRVASGRNVRGGFSVSRADVADLMLRVIDDRSTIKDELGVAS